MRVEDMMSKEMELVTPEDTLEEATRKMNVLKMDEVPVFENNAPQGMLSRHDITTRVAVNMDDPRKVVVREVMKHVH